ncbi:hypothetical protein BDP55DRAFT_758181 [Colletotrichum godetiae]|uniref:Uncharacterized protein n=1 Tax=Colletotrichum godetiae TaxID=1209918 RepID=A0AAJ0ATF3_9PEZI|nr:uncharacterized protein BDP55DRAFT_758181 [Colletotrichum godetiae]KAK1690044.1 hypothetical protein BDP55DRAFT_758181 [Colletotrichum godetiae]
MCSVWKIHYTKQPQCGCVDRGLLSSTVPPFAARFRFISLVLRLLSLVLWAKAHGLQIKYRDSSAMQKRIVASPCGQPKLPVDSKSLSGSADHYLDVCQVNSKLSFLPLFIGVEGLGDISLSSSEVRANSIGTKSIPVMPPTSNVVTKPHWHGHGLKAGLLTLTHASSGVETGKDKQRTPHLDLINRHENELWLSVNEDMARMRPIMRGLTYLKIP